MRYFDIASPSLLNRTLAALRFARYTHEIILLEDACALARKLEPRTLRPDLRLAAVRKLSDAGLNVGVFPNPIMVPITAREAQLPARGFRYSSSAWRWTISITSCPKT